MVHSLNFRVEANAIADKLIDKDVAKQKLTQMEAAEVRARLLPSTKMDQLFDVDFVIEAVPVCSIQRVIVIVHANGCSGNTRPESQDICPAR